MAPLEMAHLLAARHPLHQRVRLLTVSPETFLSKLLIEIGAKDGHDLTTSPLRLPYAMASTQHLILNDGQRSKAGDMI